jgi:hypothetical protein
MRSKAFVFAVLMIIGAGLSVPAWADQIILKNGQRYSGKFLKGSSSAIEFQILGRAESFSIAEVAQIIFQEPELVAPPADRGMVASPAPSTPPTASVPPRPSAPPAARPSPASDPQPREVPPDNSAGGSAVTLPTGTAVTIRTTEAIDTDRNRVGDVFNATLEDPLTYGDQTIAPRGTPIKGRIAYSQETGKVTGQSELILELTEMNLNGNQYVLRTSDYQQVGSSTGRRTATAAGGGAALGAIIGAIAGGGKGAAIGAGTGAVVGTGAAVMTRGQTLKVPVETVLQFRLQSPLTVQIP